MLATDLHVAIAAAQLGTAESLVLGVAINQLYGPKKMPLASLSAAEIAKKTGLKKTSLIRARNSLVAYGLLEETAEGYRFHKDYEAWMRNGRPMLSATMVEYAASFILRPSSTKPKGVAQKRPEGRAEETPGVAQKRPEGRAEETPGVAQKRPEGRAEETPGVAQKRPTAHAPYMYPSEDSGETKKKAVLYCLPACDADGHAREESAAEPSGPIVPLPPQSVEPPHQPNRDALDLFKPMTTDPRKADLALRVLSLIEEHYGDRDSAEAYACAALKYADAGLSAFAILEAFRRAVAADVAVIRVGQYVAKTVRAIEAGLAPDATDPGQSKPKPVFENALARRTRELQEGLRKRFAPPKPEGGTNG